MAPSQLVLAQGGAYPFPSRGGTRRARSCHTLESESAQCAGWTFSNLFDDGSSGPLLQKAQDGMGPSAEKMVGRRPESWLEIDRTVTCCADYCDMSAADSPKLSWFQSAVKGIVRALVLLATRFRAPFRPNGFWSQRDRFYPCTPEPPKRVNKPSTFVPMRLRL